MKQYIVRLFSVVFILCAFAQTVIGQEVYKLRVGERLVLVASADGTPPITFVWYKDGVETGVTTAEYVISSVTPQDAGTYSVKASNSVGSATSPAVICRMIILPKKAVDTYEVLFTWLELRKDFALASLPRRPIMGRTQGGRI